MTAAPTPSPITDPWQDPHTRIIDEDDLKWWLALSDTLDWTVAKTMPDWPHSYMVRGRTLDEDDFIRAARVIRTFGDPGKFYTRTNIYLHDGHTRYWTMGEPLTECQIINRATDNTEYGEQDAPATHSGVRSVYDGLATIYDDRYTSEAAHAENSAVRKLIMQHFGAYAPSTLDVGCGTGLLLDLGITSPAIYTGLDPSQGMLNELIRKRPTVRHLLPLRMEDALDQFGTREFELVASLFGSASYLPPETIEQLPRLSSDLTVLMHYREGYLPDYWSTQANQPPHVDTSREAALGLGGYTFRLNNFDVTVVDV